MEWRGWQAETSEGGPDPSVGLVREDGRNRVKVTCELCGSVVLSPGVGRLVRLDRPLPNVRQKKELSQDGLATTLITYDPRLGSAAERVKERPVRLRHFWRVEGVFDYDNVGFTRSVDGLKFLICADCEVGPLGYQVSSSRLCSPIFLSRIHVIVNSRTRRLRPRLWR